MTRKFTFRRFGEGFLTVIRRFPIPVALMAACAVSLIVFIHNGKDLSDKTQFFCLFFFSTAALLDACLTLWAETTGRKGLSAAVRLASGLLWLGLCILLSRGYPFDDEWTLGIASLVVLLIVLFFLLPFLRGKYDIQLWNFTFKSIVSLVVSFAVGLVMFGGLSLLLTALRELFALKIGDNAYYDMAAISMVFIAPVLFLQLLPSEDALRDNRTDRPGKFGGGVVHYLLMPLLGAYLLVLYVYAAKILFTWNLPQGWVSILVTVSMGGMLLVTVLLYPTQFREGGSFDKKALRLLPAIMLPLLVLMSVAIGKRVSDYGITAPRLYVILFNLWCYVVCIVLVISRFKRFWWILASFAVLFFLSSVGPWNFSAVSERSFERRGIEKEAKVAKKLYYSNYSLGNHQIEVPQGYSRVLVLNQSSSNSKIVAMRRDTLEVMVCDSVRLNVPVAKLKEFDKKYSAGVLLFHGPKALLLVSGYNYSAPENDASTESGNISLDGTLFLK